MLDWAFCGKSTKFLMRLINNDILFVSMAQNRNTGICKGKINKFLPQFERTRLLNQKNIQVLNL